MQRLYRHIAIGAILLTALLYGCTGGSKAKIEGNIVGLPDGIVYLSVYEHSFRVVDSTRSNEGRFKFDMPEILPDVVFIGFESDSNLQLPIIVEGEDLEISGNYTNNEEIEVSGSRANEDLKRYRESVNRYNVMLKAIDVSIGEYSDTVELIDTLRQEALFVKRDSVQMLIDNSQRRFIEENPTSIVSAMFVLQILSQPTNKQNVEQMIQKLDGKNMPDNAFLRRIYRRREEFK